MRRRLSAVMLSLLLAPAAFAAEHHVSPTGSVGGDGSQANPWDLATAFAQPASVQPGDTLWLHGGTYSGAFTSALSGTAASPITVRSAAGEWARIDGGGASDSTFTVNGQDAIYRDFEVTNSDTDRAASRPGGVDVFGARVKLVNLVIHDTGGNGFWSSAEGSEIYGCTIFHNGYDATDRGHGHGIYTQNATGTKTIADNVIFGGYSFGIHVYTESGSIQGYDLVGNVLFNAGVISSVSGHKDDCLVGGLQPADRIALRENLVWAIGGDTRSVQLGYSVSNGAVTLEDNYVIGALKFAQPWSSVTMTGNTLCTVTGVDTAQYPDNTYLTVDPSAPRVFVRPNKYESGRAHVVVYNWLRASTVGVDLSSVMAAGAAYELRNAQDVLGAPVLSGTYAGGTLALPMTGLAPAQPVGSPGAYEVADQTGTIFNVFLLTSSGGGIPAADAGTAGGPDAAQRADSGASLVDAGAMAGRDAAEGRDAGTVATADSGGALQGADAAEGRDGGEGEDGGEQVGSSCGCTSGGAANLPGLLLAALLACGLVRRR